LFLQDDWHVTISSERCWSICLSDLKLGDRVLGHLENPGRHVRICVDETIFER
jgi:3-dehydroquinate synthase II/3-amino-4-hydroxybenzoic acid synthase